MSDGMEINRPRQPSALIDGLAVTPDEVTVFED